MRQQAHVSLYNKYKIATFPSVNLNGIIQQLDKQQADTESAVRHWEAEYESILETS